jgi:hypothetical protein
MTPNARRAVSKAGRLDSLWWARTVPESFKTTAEGLLTAAKPSVGLVPGLPLWAQSLRIAYAERYRAFANDFAQNLGAVGQLEAAQDLATAGLTILPEDGEAAQIHAYLASQIAAQQRLSRLSGPRRAHAGER